MRIFIGFLIGVLVSVAVAAIAVVTLAPGLWDADALSQPLSVRPDSLAQIFSESRSGDEEHESLSVDRTQSTEADRGMLSAVVPFPRTIVFQEADESVQMELTGVYSDGSEEALADLETMASFSSSEPDVVQVDASGLVTSVSSGGADIIVEYEEFRAQVSIIVYGPIVEIPPFDPDKVVQIEDGPEVVVNRIVVVPQTEEYDAELTEAIASEYGGAIIAEFKNLNLFSLEFDIDALDALEMKLEELEADARIESATPNFLFATAQTPTPTNTPTPIPDPDHAYKSIELEQAWKFLEDLQKQDKDALKPVHIAVIDDGFVDCYSSIDFCNTVFDFKMTITHKKWASEVGNTFHGTAVTSVISRVISRVPELDDTLHIYDAGTDLGNIGSALENILKSVDHIYPHADKIDVINMSFAGHCDAKLWICFWPVDDPLVMLDRGHIKNIIRDLGAKGTVVVVASGNNEKDAKNTFPAYLSSSFDNVITVGGLKRNKNERAEKSNYGNSSDYGNDGYEIITVAAPYFVEALNTGDGDGEDFPEGYTELDGTSFSAPLVTGVVALMRAVNPELSAKEVKSILVDTGRFGVLSPNGIEEDWKRVNAEEAVKKALRKVPTPTSTPVPTATPFSPPPTPTPRCEEALPLLGPVDGSFNECLENYYTFKLDEKTDVEFRVATVLRNFKPRLALVEKISPDTRNVFPADETRCHGAEMSLWNEAISSGFGSGVVGYVIAAISESTSEHCQVIEKTLEPGEYSVRVSMDPETYEALMTLLETNEGLLRSLEELIDYDAFDLSFRFIVNHNLSP